MPIDGVSSQNTGFQQVSAAEANVQAEANSRAEAQKQIKETSKSDETKADSDENSENRDLEGRDSGDDESDQEDSSNKTAKFLQNNKKFKVTFNSSIEMVEMIDVITGKVVETVAPEDLINILSSSKAFSGLFVDRKI